ncbi:MAG: type secretion protein [Sphingomonadales bacterium]|nr:type secretion protein [Sphingomonadales bacterium]
MNIDPPVNRPRIARARRQRSVIPAAVMFAILGGGVFATMVQGREAREARGSVLPGLDLAASTAPTALLTPAASTAPPAPSPVPMVPQVVSPITPGLTQAPGSDQARAARALERLRAPALIVDLGPGRGDYTGLAAQNAQSVGGGGSSSVGAAASDPATAGATGGLPAGTAEALSQAAGANAPVNGRRADNERFATRVSDDEVQVVEARRLNHLDRLVPQGAIIGAVLETAINSDLPGFARAIVSRDVLSFDGSAVLIPAGSHVIGQYNSGVAQGASRIFIVWTRLIRPDGVSVALGSPAIDDLGRGGVAGKVNRHFLQRFGSAILLSVLTGGISAATASLNRNGPTVIVGSTSEATSLATQADRGGEIPPTIKTPQGVNVRIFVARDLDFTSVGPVR